MTDIALATILASCPSETVWNSLKSKLAINSYCATLDTLACICSRSNTRDYSAWGLIVLDLIPDSVFTIQISANPFRSAIVPQSPIWRACDYTLNAPIHKRNVKCIPIQKFNHGYYLLLGDVQ